MNSAAAAAAAAAAVTPARGDARARGRASRRTVGKERQRVRTAARGSGGGGGRGGEIQRELANASSAEDALRVVELDLEVFDAVHAATALHRVAKFSSPLSRLDARDFDRVEAVTRDERFKALASTVGNRMNEFDAFGLANVAWSFAKIGYTPSQDTLNALASRLEREVLKHGASVKPQSLSNAAYAFGRLRYKPPKSTLEALCEATMRQMDKFRTDEFAGMMLGLAHLDHVPSAEFLGEATTFITRNLRAFDDTATCNVLWAFARMESRKLKGDVIDALLIQLASQNLGGANSHVNVPMCMYACARLNHQPSPAFINAIDKEVPRSARKMNIGSIDSMFWALGSLGGVGEGKTTLGAEAYEALCAAVATKRDIDAELVAKVFWTLAKVNYKPQDSTLVGLAKMAKGRANELDDENLIIIMHAWGVLRWNPGEEVVEEYVERFIGSQDLVPGQAAKLLCAYGRIRWSPPIEHARALIELILYAAEGAKLQPATAVLGLWGSALLGLELTAAQLDVLAQNTTKQNLSPKSLVKCVWSLAALGYDPTPVDLANLVQVTDVASGSLPVKDQSALKQAMTRLGAYS